MLRRLGQISKTMTGIADTAGSRYGHIPSSRIKHTAAAQIIGEVVSARRRTMAFR